MPRFTVEDMIEFAYFCVLSDMHHTKKSIGKVLIVYSDVKDIKFTEEEILSIKSTK